MQGAIRTYKMNARNRSKAQEPVYNLLHYFECDPLVSGTTKQRDRGETQPMRFCISFSAHSEIGLD